MKFLALITFAIFSTSSEATTFLMCTGNSNYQSRTNNEMPYQNSQKNLRFQVEFDNFEGKGTLQASGEFSISKFSNCNFTNDLLECQSAFTQSSQLGEVTQLGIRQATTSTIKMESAVKINRKTGLGEYRHVHDSKTTEPVEKAGTFHTESIATFICKRATNNQF